MVPSLAFGTVLYALMINVEPNETIIINISDIVSAPEHTTHEYFVTFRFC